MSIIFSFIIVIFCYWNCNITIFFLVALAVRVDLITGTSYVRNATIFFFLGNEGLSVIENIGRMGVKYPAFLKKALETLKEKNEET